MDILLGTITPDEPEVVSMEQVIQAAEGAIVDVGEVEYDPYGDHDIEGENSNWEAEF
jgi:hypothetical protein